MEDHEEAILTNHAVKRIRERVGVSKTGTESLAKRALLEGLSHSEVRGSLRRYVDKLFIKSLKANNIKVLHDKAYLFRGNVLITVIPLTQKLAKISFKIMKKKKEEKLVA